ncbi:MAG: carbon-nitrogen hydrolase family protein [Nitrososphaerota archaeon]|nr:carbon-nitrogen hydrolase family protein [Aigarchaeota archaeon]MDW8076113.1 carbon-nitrogen hydrolase family protein [Nitrososphaerota archaeon]
MVSSGLRQSVRVAAVQMEPGENVQENIAKAESLIRAAADAGAEFICLPEMWLHKEPIPHVDEVLDSTKHVLSSFSRLAKGLNVTLIPGAVYEEDGDDVFISAYVIAPDGNIIGKQQKVHLFRDEKNFFKSGTKFEVFVVNGIRFGIMVCYDVAFPESARCLTIKGAELIFNPSRIVKEAMEPWRLYVKARCLENRMPIVAVNIYDSAHPGGSFICAPLEGAKRFVHPVVLTQADHGPTTLTCDIDLVNIVEFRIDRLSRRVPAAYRCLVEQNDQSD